MRKVLIILMVIYSFHIFAKNGRETKFVDSPDGNYQISYLVNSEDDSVSGSLVNELYLIDKKFKSNSVILEDIQGVDSIVWSPDSNWLMIETYDRFGVGVWFLNIKNKKHESPDIWGYLEKHQKGFKRKDLSPWSDIAFKGWSDNGKIAHFSYSYEVLDKAYEGELIFDFVKFKIIKLIPAMENKR